MCLSTDDVESFSVDGKNVDIVYAANLFTVLTHTTQDTESYNNVSELPLSQSTSAAHLYSDITSMRLNVCLATFKFCDPATRDLPRADFSFSYRQFPILSPEECTTSIIEESLGERSDSNGTIRGRAYQNLILMALTGDIDGGLGHTHKLEDRQFNIQDNDIVMVGLILFFAQHLFRIAFMIRQMCRQGLSFVGSISTPTWWPKMPSDKHRCWEALDACGPTETLHFHDRLLLLYLVVAIYLLPLLLVVHRNNASGARTVVYGCFHMVLLAAVLATTANRLIIDKLMRSNIRHCVARAWALGASEAHIETVRRSNVQEQSVLELLHYLTRTYGQLRRMARRFGANNSQINLPLILDTSSKRAAIILYLLHLRECAMDTGTGSAKSNVDEKLVHKGATNARSKMQIFVNKLDGKTILVIATDN
eukprot:SAG11_NODE_4667_length_1814_cov_1.410496_1_plen_421_part_01